MKKNKLYILSAIAFSIQFCVQAQTTPEAFLGQLPPIPSNVCNTDKSEVEAFSDKIYNLKQSMNDMADRIHSEADANRENTKEKLRANLAGQSGLSKGEIKKMENEEVSEDQENKFTEGFLGKQYGLSTEDVKALQNMSEEEQQQWAKGYINKQGQKAANNPEETSLKEEKNERIFNLAKEQNEIGEKINEKRSIEEKMLKEIELQDTLATRSLNEKIRPLEIELRNIPDGAGATPATIRRTHELMKQIYNLKIQYCEKMSPLQINYIDQCLTNLKILMPDYRRYFEAGNELSKIQYGVETAPVDLGILSEVEKYANILDTAYKYCVGKFE